MKNKKEEKKKMKPATNPAFVPKLRFPEFRDAGEWEEKAIGNSCETFSGGTPNTSNKEFYGGKIPFIRSAEINKDKTELFLTKEGLINSAAKMIRKGDLLVALYGANSGDVALAKIDGAINQAILCLRHENNNAFVYQYLAHKKSWIISTYIQGGQGNLSGEIIKSIQLYFPHSKEQHKIADCLSSLDELITAEAEKLDTLKAHKKGLMQQLFPAEGETVPRLRFPEFLDAGEWEESKLGEFIEEFREKSSIQDEFEALTSARSGLVRQREYYDNNRITERDNIGFNIIPPNYMTYRSRSDDRRFYFNENNLKITGIISIYYPVFRIIGGNNKFFIELLSCYSKTVGKYSVGTSQTVLSLNELKRVKLPIPLEAEQHKIADCLSSLDELITGEAQKLDMLKAHKKGLMQQLFPAELTDKTHE
jgi:restriction endonuclease S subunit